MTNTIKYGIVGLVIIGGFYLIHKRMTEKTDLMNRQEELYRKSLTKNL